MRFFKYLTVRENTKEHLIAQPRLPISPPFKLCMGIVEHFWLCSHAEIKTPYNIRSEPRQSIKMSIKMLAHSKWLDRWQIEVQVRPARGTLDSHTFSCWHLTQRETTEQHVERGWKLDRWTNGFCSCSERLNYSLLTFLEMTSDLQLRVSIFIIGN